MEDSIGKITNITYPNQEGPLLTVKNTLEKCKDPGTFCIPCIIGNSKFENAMLDLGASVSVMPLSIFNSLSLGPLQSIDVVIHLANRSVAYPAGFIEDVLVQVG